MLTGSFTAQSHSSTFIRAPLCAQVLVSAPRLAALIEKCLLIPLCYHKSCNIIFLTSMQISMQLDFAVGRTEHLHFYHFGICSRHYSEEETLSTEGEKKPMEHKT